MSQTTSKYIFAIETSCDETAAAIIKDGKEIVANVVASQMDSHKRFGGVVPEIASRHHVEQMTQVLEVTFNQADMTQEAMDAVAVRGGPGDVGARIAATDTA